MTRSSTLLSGKLVLATIVATGMAAAPVALNSSGMLQPNAAGAQENSAQETESNGAAMQRQLEALEGTTVGSADNVYRILGTTRAEAEQADTRLSASTHYGPLAGYQQAVESGNLDAATDNLAAISKRPITVSLVNQVNRELGLDTRLTSQQIADVAASKQEQIQGQVPGSAVEARQHRVYSILGTTPERAEQADTTVSATTHYGPLSGYQEAVESGNLDVAASNLAAVAERPITPQLVTEVNRELGVETRLPAQQIADAAARMQSDTTY